MKPANRPLRKKVLRARRFLSVLKCLTFFACICTGVDVSASFCSKTNHYRNGIVNTAKGAVATAGTGAGIAGTATVVGVTAVTHSSGAAILTGGAGYVAGSMGVAAGTVAAAPILVFSGLAVAGLTGGALWVCRSKADE